jgi:hypothetical protein
MGTALLVALPVFIVVVGIALLLAWSSATGRLYRLDRAVGAEAGQSSRWAWLLSGGFGAAYTVLGVSELVRGHRGMGVADLMFATFWGLVFPVAFWIRRRRRSQDHREDRPGPGRPPEAGP